MYRSYLEPKYTYVTYAFNKYIPSTLPPSSQNWSLWALNAYFPADWSSYSPIVKFEPLMPALGTSRNMRIGNDITVSSIRLQIHMKMGIRFSQAHFGNFCHQAGTYPDDDDAADALIYKDKFFDAPSMANYPQRDRWYKCRIFCIEFNEGMAITPATIRSWFFSVFCPYYIDAAATYNPTSVHSNLLNPNTNYSGKFNILLDKCLTLHSTRPSISLDMTLPLRKKFKFNESSGDLIGPNVVCFIMPPMSIEYDVDQQSRHELESNTVNKEAIDFLNGHCFIKLNYTDL